MEDHTIQNTYLRGCVKNTDLKDIRRRPRSSTSSSKPRASYVYSVSIGSKSEKVCQAAFVGLHGIKKTRLKAKVLQLDQDIQDGRGKHGEHRKISDDVRNLIRKHVSSFPARESHYSRSKNTHRKYLDASLTVAAMHNDFIKSNPELDGIAKYWLYNEIFNTEFNISFGYPRSDICDTCERYQVMLKAAESNNDAVAIKKIRIDNELHIRKADVFNVQLKEVTEQARNQETQDTVVLAMDYQKNLPLPLTGVSQEYYKRQLWIHNFCIHECTKEKATMFLYAEHYAGKGPNDVLSCLQYYIKTLPLNITKIELFADNCFSQNKNRYLLAYFHTLVHNSRFTVVNMHYPLPGHSRMPCDRDFGRIEKKRRVKDKVSLPSEWVELVKSTDHESPFTVAYVEHPLTNDLQDDGTPVVPVIDFKRAFDPMLRTPKGISTIRGIQFLRGSTPRCRYSMTGGCDTDIMFLKRGQKVKSLIAALNPLLLRRAYPSFLPIKAAKLVDVKQLLQFVFLPESVTFYSVLWSNDQPESEEEYE